ncbi:MAG: pantetheine-phosphate adenylyltransferase [Bdellovibrionales bacterium]|nr:pantetheine-phosphate adenylyltransferase [Bdellovibrionales bacterium]
MKRIAIYPGSFDPITLGHVDIISRALPLFDELYICISNSSKKTYLFSLEERKQLLIDNFSDTKKVKTMVNAGLTVDAARSVDAKFIVRGIRTNMDAEYEKSMDVMNKALNNDIETIFLFANPTLSSISSSLVKEVALLKGDVSSFVPKNVAQALKTKMG